MLWQVELPDKSASRVKCRRLREFSLSERDFQGVLFRQLDHLWPDDELLLLMQSRRWREEPDLLAIDSQGKLFIFEVKASESNPENLLQVLRYGQILGQYDYQDLDRLYRTYWRTDRSLSNAHEAAFSVPLAQSNYNPSQVFVVIVNGLDSATREAIEYWRRRGLDVRPWAYRVYEGGNSRMLVELNPFRVADNPYEDIDQGYYVLNTNISNSPQDDAYMLREGRAAAFFDPWNLKIERLGKGDTVFLYRTGQGIVAVGTATGKVDKRCYHGDPQYQDEEYSMALTNFKLMDPIITAAEVKAVTGRNVVFRQTMFGLDQEPGQKLHDRAVKSSQP